MKRRILIIALILCIAALVYFLFFREGSTLNSYKTLRGVEDYKFGSSGGTFVTINSERIRTLNWPDLSVLQDKPIFIPNSRFAWSDNGSWIALQTKEGIEIWRISDGQRTTKLPSTTSSTVQWQFNREGTILVTAGFEQKEPVHLWHLTNGIVTSEQNLPQTQGLINLSPDGRILATTSNYQIVFIDTSSGNIIQTISLPVKTELSAMTFSSNSTLFAATGRNQKVPIWLWRISDGELISTFEYPDGINDLSFNSDETLLAAGGGDTEPMTYTDTNVRIWRITDGKQIYIVNQDIPVEKIRFSPDGQSIVVSSFDGSVRFWRLAH